MAAMGMLQEALPQGKRMTIIQDDILAVDEKELFERVGTPKKVSFTTSCIPLLRRIKM